MAEAQHALGTQLKRGNGEDPEDFNKIAKVTNISGPELSLDTQDVTDHDSEDGWEEVIPTILRSGEVGLELSFIPTDEGHTGLISDMVDRVKRNFELVFPDEEETTWSFSAYVVGFSCGAPHDNKLEGEATLKITGKPTLALGTQEV